MRQSQNNPQTIANQLKRQAEQGTSLVQAQIVSQAQALDSQGQPTQFFYNSTVQSATAVTKALKARFTWIMNAQSQASVPPDPQPSASEEMKSAPLLPEPRTSWSLETNLITFASNVLKVYSLPGEDNPHMDLRLSTQFNGRILDIIKVPTLPFLLEEREGVYRSVNSKVKTSGLNQPSAREMRVSKRKQQQRVIIDTSDAGKPEATVEEEEAPADYLFIVLANFTVALVCHNRNENKLEVVSRGNISEKMLHGNDQKEAPYPIFLGQTGKFIVLMLYHNILKVIPLVLRDDPSTSSICTLTHATAVRVCHSNVMQVIPLYQEGSLSEQATFGVIYQRIDHIRIPGVVGPPSLQIKIELEKQIFDLDRRDLTALDKNGGKLEFSSNSVYRIEPVPFGGFLAFDVDSVAYYRGERLSSSGGYHEQLKSTHSVSAFCQVDEFDIEKGCTASGSPFVRFLFATEAGELFMLAMHVETLNNALGGAGLDLNDSLITIEFLAQKLTFCSSLVYLDDSLVFYSSKEGDSYIIRICAEHQNCSDQPYVRIEQRFTSLAPITDLQLARPENTQGQQAELVVVAGWNHQTNMNIVKQGVGLRSIKSFESVLPAGMVQEFFVLQGGDRVFMRIYGYEQLIGVQVKQLAAASDRKSNDTVLAVDGFDVSRNLSVKPDAGKNAILALERVILKVITLDSKPSLNGNQAVEDEAMAVDQQAAEEEAAKESIIDVLVFATDSSIKILEFDNSGADTSNGAARANNCQADIDKQSPFHTLNGDPIGSKILCETSVEEGSRLTLVKVSSERIIVAQQGGSLKECRLVARCPEADSIQVTLEEVARIEMGSEVSAMVLSEDSEVVELLYLTLYDAPHYSLNVIGLSSDNGDESLRILARLPLASILEMNQTSKFYQHLLVRNGDVFTQFNHEASASAPKHRPEMLQDLPGGAPSSQQLADDAPATMIEATIQDPHTDNNYSKKDHPYQTTKAPASTDEHPSLLANGGVAQHHSIAFRFDCSAGRSIEHLTMKSQLTDTVIIGFANGKLLQICVDLAQIRQIIKGDPDECAPFLDFQTYVEQRINMEKKFSTTEGDVADQSNLQHHQDLNLEHCGPFWGTQVSYVGTVLPKLRKIMTDQNKEAVIACCDRPVVFYEANDSVEMHYLAYRQIRDIGCMMVDRPEGGDRALLLYEDERGVLNLSENDSLRRLQVQRMVFKMQISKTLLVPANDSIVVLLEQPNMDYIDTTKQASNCVALVSRSTMRTQAVFRLQKGEIANCAIALGSSSTKMPTTKGNKENRKWILIGTAFLNPEETLPSCGRILMLDAQRMELVQEFKTNGSVQSILVSEKNKFLLLGVNNQIQAYEMRTFLPSMRANTNTFVKAGKFEMLCQKSSGTFIQSIVRLAAPGSTHSNSTELAQSIIVGDMTGRGVSTFELKECRISQVKIVESASSHISLWVNSIVALSSSQFIVFDHEGNLFIFQKNLYPTCIEEKLKLTLKASFHIGEQVQSAAFGSLRSTSSMLQLSDGVDQQQLDEAQSQAASITQGSKILKKKQSYVERQITAAAVSDEARKESVDQEMVDTNEEKDKKVMIVTRGSLAKQSKKSQEVLDWTMELTNPANYGKILRDMEFARRFAAKTLEEMMFIMQAQKCSLIYGTADGSIGSLFQIPPKVYLLLQLLQYELDQHTYVDLVQQKRSEYRNVKQTAATSTELQGGKYLLNGIIDGDLVEVFLDLPKNKKLEFARSMLGLGGRAADEEFTELLVQIVSLMKKTH